VLEENTDKSRRRRGFAELHLEPVVCRPDVQAVPSEQLIGKSDAWWCAVQWDDLGLSMGLLAPAVNTLTPSLAALALSEDKHGDQRGAVVEAEIGRACKGSTGVGATRQSIEWLRPYQLPAVGVTDAGEGKEDALAADGGRKLKVDMLSYRVWCFLLRFFRVWVVR